MRSAIEGLGLDWFKILLGKPAFQYQKLPYPATLGEVRDHIGMVTDAEKLDYGIEYCETLLDREEDRLGRIESKAFTLVGITGISTAFITAFAGLLLDPEKITQPLPLLIAAVLFYVLVVASMIWTIYLAVKVVMVGHYRFAYPAASDVLRLPHATLNCVKRERWTALFYSIIRNQQVVNEKATFLIGAQLWFRNSVVLLFVLTLLLGFYALLRARPVASPTPVLTTTPVATTSPVPSPSHTPFPTNAPTPAHNSTPTPKQAATASPTTPEIPSATVSPPAPLPQETGCGQTSSLPAIWEAAVYEALGDKGRASCARKMPRHQLPKRHSVSHGTKRLLLRICSQPPSQLL